MSIDRFHDEKMKNKKLRSTFDNRPPHQLIEYQDKNTILLIVGTLESYYV